MQSQEQNQNRGNFSFRLGQAIAAKGLKQKTLAEYVGGADCLLFALFAGGLVLRCVVGQYGGD